MDWICLPHRPPTHQSPPVLGLMFKNRDAGREIFAQWRQELGHVDQQEQLRLTVVRGIDKAHPHAYRVIVGSDPTAFPTNTRFANFVSRIHRMDAVTSENLDRFLRARDAVGAFFLAPAFVQPDFDASYAPDVDLDLGIGVRFVHVRQAWEIGPRDIEAVAIHEDDDPLIPEGIETPPVLELLHHQRGV